METVILTKENLNQIIPKLQNIANDKRYWIGVASGRIESVEDPGHEWFRGVGTFERIAHLIFSENHNGYGIQIGHLNAVENSSVIPENDTIRFGAEIIIDGNDILYFEDNKHISPRGGTCLYMEWTKRRSQMYA